MDRVRSGGDRTRLVVALQCFTLLFVFLFSLCVLVKKDTGDKINLRNVTNLIFEIDNHTIFKIDTTIGSLAYLYNKEHVVLLDLNTIKRDPSHLLKCLRDSFERLQAEDYVNCDIYCTRYSMQVCFISPEDGAKLFFSPTSISKIIMVIQMIVSSL